METQLVIVELTKTDHDLLISLRGGVKKIRTHCACAPPRTRLAAGGIFTREKNIESENCKQTWYRIVRWEEKLARFVAFVFFYSLFIQSETYIFVFLLDGL